MEGVLLTGFLLEWNVRSVNSVKVMELVSSNFGFCTFVIQLVTQKPNVA